MPTPSKPAPKFPTVAVMIPKMETSPSTSSSQEPKKANESAAEAPILSTLSTTAPEEKKVIPSREPVIDNELLESEMKLVSSLAKLQKLETMIHELRTLLPERLLEPLAPIVNPRATAAMSAPESPQKLFEQLSQAARGGVAEVEEFQTMWRSPEVKAVWDRVETQIKENGGQLLQPTGMWEYDYDTLLEDLTKQDNIRKEQQQRAKEELERSKLQSAEGGWKSIAENFSRKAVPGMHVLTTNNDSSFIVLLARAGLAFKIHTSNSIQAPGIPEWQVSSRPTIGQPVSKLETAVLSCLNSRPRKWDLTYLLEMISSYSSMKQTPCVKCGKMTDNATNLPTLRRPKAVEGSNESQSLTWEAHHPTCV